MYIPWSGILAAAMATTNDPIPRGERLVRGRGGQIVDEW
jgi:hypothetical protein